MTYTYDCMHISTGPWILKNYYFYLLRKISKEHLTVVNLGARFAQETQQGQEQLNSCKTGSASLIPRPRRWLLWLGHLVIPKFQFLKHPLPQLFLESQMWFIHHLMQW